MRAFSDGNQWIKTVIAPSTQDIRTYVSVCLSVASNALPGVLYSMYIIVLSPPLIFAWLQLQRVMTCCSRRHSFYYFMLLSLLSDVSLRVTRTARRRVCVVSNQHAEYTIAGAINCVFEGATHLVFYVFYMDVSYVLVV